MIGRFTASSFGGVQGGGLHARRGGRQRCRLHGFLARGNERGQHDHHVRCSPLTLCILD